MAKSIKSMQDSLAKLQAKTKLVGGGSQYSPEVSQHVASINRGHAQMRNQKEVQGAPKPLPLRKLQKRN